MQKDFNIKLCPVAKQNVCTRCDLPYILKNYITPLMQLLSNDMQQYSMRLKTTKCLNTGIMLLTFMAGRKKGLQVVDYCNNNRVIERHQSGKETNYDVLDEYIPKILSKHFKLRQLYYFLISDGTLHHPSDASSTMYFPGHVFIFEKSWDNRNIVFNFYQSYINQYDLQGHFEKRNFTMQLSAQELGTLLKKISYILVREGDLDHVTDNTWDTTCSAYWKDLTGVDASQFEGFSLKGNMYVCCKGITLKECVHNIKQYIDDTLRQINVVPNQNDQEVYGSKELYKDNFEDNSSRAYSKSAMKQSLNRLLIDIKIKEEESMK